jgi:hypothetical protein
MRNVGEVWAYREKSSRLGETLHPVEIVKPGPRLSKKTRVRWLDGEFEGLDTWVPTQRLLVPWDEADAFLRDERAELSLMAVQPPRVDDDLARAVEQVWFASPSGSIDFQVHRRYPLWADIRDFERLSSKLPISRDELLTSPGAYIDRTGTLHVGQDMTLQLAEALCRSESGPILQHGEEELDRLESAVLTGWMTTRFPNIEPYQVARDAARNYLREHEAARATIRDWCGVDAVTAFDELQSLREGNERLRRELEDLVAWLKTAGHTGKASSLGRTLTWMSC